MSERTFGMIGMIVSIVVFLSVAIFSGKLLPLSLNNWPGLVGGVIIGLTLCIYVEGHWPKPGAIAAHPSDVPEHRISLRVTKMVFGVVSAIVVIGLSIFALYMGLSLRSAYGNIGLSCFIILGAYLIYKNITYRT